MPEIKLSSSRSEVAFLFGTSLALAGLVVWVSVWISFPAEGYRGRIVMVASFTLALAGLVRALGQRDRRGIALSLIVLVLSVLVGFSNLALGPAIGED